MSPPPRLLDLFSFFWLRRVEDTQRLHTQERAGFSLLRMSYTLPLAQSETIDRHRSAHGRNP